MNASLAIRLTRVDSIAPDFDRAIDLCLFHQYEEAEQLLTQIIHQPTHPNCIAAFDLLAHQVYFLRGEYQKYCKLAENFSQPLPQLQLARLLADRPPLLITLPTDSTIVEFRLKKKGHAVVEVTINDKLHRFLVDTGCERTLISTKLAAELQLPPLQNSHVSNSLGQTIPSVTYCLDSLQLGSLSIKNLPVNDGSLWGFDVDGALGWDILRQLCFTFDYKARQLTLRKPVARLVNDKNLLGGSRPFMVFQSDVNQPLILFYDSGSNERISFSPNGLTKIGPHRIGRRIGFQLGLGGLMRMQRERTIREAKIRLDKQIYTLKKAFVKQSDEQIQNVIIDGVVGSRQFNRGRLTIDFANNRFDYLP